MCSNFLNLKGEYDMLKIIQILCISFLISINLHANEFKIGQPYVDMGHSSNATSLNIVLNEKYALTSNGSKYWFSSKSRVLLWNLENGTIKYTKKGHLIYLSKNKKNAVIKEGKNRYSIFDVKTGKNINSFKGEFLNKEIKKDIVLFKDSKKNINIINIEKGSSISIIPNNIINKDTIFKISKDNKIVLIINTNIITLWDISNSKSFFTLDKKTTQDKIKILNPKYYKSSLEYYSWSNVELTWNSKYFRAYGYYINIKTNEISFFLNSNDKILEYYLLKEYDNKAILSKVYGEELIYANIDTKEILFKIPVDNHIARKNINFLSNKNIIYTIDKKIHGYSIKNKKLIYTIDKSKIEYLSKDLSFGILKQNDKRYWFNPITGKILNSFSSSYIYDITDNKKALLIKKGDKTIEYWDLNQQKILKTLGLGKVLSSVSPNGKIFASARGKTVEIWDSKKLNLLKKITFKNKIYTMKFSFDNKHLLLNFDSYTIYNYYNLVSLRDYSIDTFSYSNKACCLSDNFSPDSKYIAIGGMVTKIKIYDIEKKKFTKSVKCGHNNNVSFSKNNKMLVYGNTSGKFSIKKVKDSTLIKRFTHTKGLGTVNTFATFINDDKVLLGWMPGKLKFWDIASGKLINTIKVPKKYSSTPIIHNNKLYFTKNDILEIDLATSKTNKYAVNSDGWSDLGFLGEDILVFSTLKGSIRFWNTKTKEKLLDVMTFPDNEWIAITKDGYFDSSKNGASYLKIKTDKNTISNIDMFYEQFYRPDIVAKVLTGKSDNIQYAQIQTPKVTLKDIKPAPDIKIVRTATSIDKEDLQITLKITPKKKFGYGQIRLYLDGTLIKTDNDRALKVKKKDNSIYKTYTLKIPKGTHNIKALVFNKNNTMQSVDAIHTVVSSYNSIYKPNIYAVVIGINEYKNPTLTLKYAVPDAKLFADTIKKQTKGLFENVKVNLLISKNQTTKENISKVLNSLQNLHPTDMFIFYVASHGMVEDAKYHMITSNVGALSSRKIKQEAISQEQLKELIANIPTTKKFIILDTCNSGALGQVLEVALLTRGLTQTTAMKVLSRAVGSTIISASSSTQEALEGYKGHGLLTYVLTEGLKGKADSDRDGFVKTLEISNYVEDTVPQIAEKEFNRAQYPYVSPLGQGFPLVKVK